MSVHGKDARCVVTKSNLNNMIKHVNESTKLKINKIPIQFALDDISSRCLREYIDLLLMDITSKYVNVMKYEQNNRNRNKSEKNHNNIDREKLILHSIIRNSNHLILDKEVKHTLHQCFIENANDTKSDNGGKSISLNSIFLKD
eukprot:294909_1